MQNVSRCLVENPLHTVAFASQSSPPRFNEISVQDAWLGTHADKSEMNSKGEMRLPERLSTYTVSRSIHFKSASLVSCCRLSSSSLTTTFNDSQWTVSRTQTLSLHPTRPQILLESHRELSFATFIHANRETGHLIQLRRSHFLRLTAFHRVWGNFHKHHKQSNFCTNCDSWWVTSSECCKNYAKRSTDFRTIALGDICLLHEIGLKRGSRTAERLRDRCSGRRVYSAKIVGLEGNMTVATYQGDGAEEVRHSGVLDITSYLIVQQWRADITRHSWLR
jgi:hypothetical protein